MLVPNVIRFLKSRVILFRKKGKEIKGKRKIWERVIQHFTLSIQQVKPFCKRFSSRSTKEARAGAVFGGAGALPNRPFVSQAAKKLPCSCFLYTTAAKDDRAFFRQYNQDNFNMLSKVQMLKLHEDIIPGRQHNHTKLIQKTIKKCLIIPIMKIYVITDIHTVSKVNI